MGDTLAPPAGALFARIVVRKTILGRVASLLFRVPGLELRIRTADGHVQRFRLVSALAEAGFLLSPAVTDLSQFAALARGQPLPSRQVVSMSVASSTAASAFFAQNIAIEFRPLSLRPSPPTPEAQAAAHLLGMTDPATR